MRKLFAVLALLLAPALASAQLQGYVVPQTVTPVSSIIQANDVSVAIVIKYFPPAGGSTTALTPKVAVEANGDLTFTVAGAAYTGFELPFSGALGGVIDVSDAEANTVGETVDAINSTPITFATGYFRAALVNALRSDVISTQAWLADAADTEVGRTDLGEIVYWDTSELDDDNIAFYDRALGASAFIGKRDVAKNPFADTTSLIQFGRFLITNGGTVGDFTIYAVTDNYISGKGCNAAGDCGSGSEVVRTVAVLPAATATEVLLSTYFGAGQGNGVLAKGERVFVRMDADATSSATLYSLSGIQFPSVK